MEEKKRDGRKEKKRKVMEEKKRKEKKETEKKNGKDTFEKARDGRSISGYCNCSVKLKEKGKRKG